MGSPWRMGSACPASSSLAGALGVMDSGMRLRLVQRSAVKKSFHLASKLVKNLLLF